MDWTEICIRIPTAAVDAATAIANMTVPYGVYIEDYSDLEQGAREIAHIDLIDEELRKKDRSAAIIHIYVEPTDNPAEAETVREEDWAHNSKKFFKPLPVGERLLVCPSWEEAGDAAKGRAVLRIDPGMAFGTGGHDTTRLVLETLQKHLKAGDTLLDVGCGSGILGIAGCLLGAASALLVDIDALAVKTAVENGEMNGLRAPRYTVVLGDLVDKVSGQFDVITANIVADAIIALSPAVEPFLKPDGVYIVSGIIDTREADVLPALKAAGFAVVERHAHGGWVCLVCKRG